MLCFLDFSCFSPRLSVDIICKYCSLLLSLDFVLSSSLPCLCVTIMKSRIEIVVIIAQFPDILPVQFQWPNNVLAGSAHAGEHNGDPQKCYNEGLSCLPAPALSPHGERCRAVHSPEAGAQESKTSLAFCWQLHKWLLVPSSKKEGRADIL